PVPRDTPVGWQEHVADLESLRKQWAIDHLTLLGYSWGGLLAVLYALEHPERVGRLALVAPAPLTAQWREQFDRRLAARMADPWIARARAELVHGVFDPMPIESARETAALLDTGVIELATGHAPHVEATEDFVRALDRFLPRR